MHDWVEVKRMYARGVKIKQIAKQLKMSKNTVKRLIRQKEEPIYKRETYSTKIDQYKENIKIWYLDPEYDFIGTRIYRELKKLGYDGSINPIYRYLAQLKEEKTKISKRATVRFETPMGEQAQFDWSPYKVFIDNELKEIYCLTMILSSSRLKACVISLTIDGEAIYEAIQELFEDLGGVTQELIIDNPKALVLENTKDAEPVYNINALRLAMHLGTELNACNPYRARTKGKIEKPYQYIEEQFIKGNSYKTMTEFSEKAKAFVREWCNEVHGTTKRIPSQAHKEELQHLIPLPTKRFMMNDLEKRKVSLDSLISIDGRKYSVPAEYIEKEVLFRIVYGFKIEIYDINMSFITSHEIKTNKENSIKDEHFLAIAHQTPKSIPEIKRQFQATFNNGAKYLEQSSKLLQQPSYHARQILKLKELYTNESLEAILEYCINNQMYSINEVKKVLKEKYIDIVILKGSAIINGDVESNINNDSTTRCLSYYEGGGQI